MLDNNTRVKISKDIMNVYKTREQLPMLSTTYPDIEVEDSYRIQELVLEQHIKEGSSIKGYKIGMTSKAMQEQAGSDEPDFSAMIDDWFFPEGLPIPYGDFFSPMIEVEIAFVMKHALKGPGILPVDVIRATDFVVPAIEIIDFRVKPEKRVTFVDTVADLAYYGGIVIGANPRTLDSIDVRAVSASLHINGEKVDEGISSAVLGNPVNAVAWLANKMSEFGKGFEAGQVILSGSFTRAIPIKSGDEIVCHYDHGLGDITFSFD